MILSLFAGSQDHYFFQSHKNLSQYYYNCQLVNQNSMT